ncbi:hypothetical protein FHS42_006294 [Streptomyces zagrosensis]|uniref:Uncharacterized protein n=1 Tax=Streptomyces zagrosensis TaxID=1042984 RepID=A0A7W9QFJ0_9ACTN|nr:hypothetical protein [Streptomyces zagrosensis]
MRNIVQAEPAAVAPVQKSGQTLDVCEAIGQLIVDTGVRPVFSGSFDEVAFRRLCSDLPVATSSVGVRRGADLSSCSCGFTAPWRSSQGMLSRLDAPACLDFAPLSAKPPAAGIPFVTVFAYRSVRQSGAPISGVHCPVGSARHGKTETGNGPDDRHRL